ncbi:Ig-like domain-containing protein [Secundilactobacillus kimchicus]|uniref:Ig-like domain-containing protein n=1 Tax=Secundilactobacillus kimchicus TaxID=528209 RepID=UPI0024A90FF2|nr:Ig-like domain-containing protein [Secundilactobacillus kimchicus]
MAKKFDVFDATGKKILTSTSPITLTGLTPHTKYEGYTVSDGTITVPVDDIVTTDVVPDLPGLSVVAGNGQVTYTITPGKNDGSPVRGYKIYYDGKTFAAGMTLSGTITGLTNAVKLTFTATATNDAGESKMSNAVQVTPQDPSMVASVEYPQTEYTIKTGETMTITAKVLPATATDQGVYYTSGDESIAKYNQDTGLVTAGHAGNVKLLATAKGDDTKTATCMLHVVNA